MNITRFVAAGLVVVLAGCGDGGDPSPTALPVATATPPSTVHAPAVCEERPTVCELAATILTRLQAGDTTQFADIASPIVGVTCEATIAHGPLCDGLAAGQLVDGFNVGVAAKAARLVSRDEFLDSASQALGRVDPSEAQSTKLLSIGCQSAEPPATSDCARDIAIAFEVVTYEAGYAAALLFQQDAAGGLGLYGLYSGAPIDDSTEAPLLVGGEGGFAGVFPGGDIGRRFFFEPFAGRMVPAYPPDQRTGIDAIDDLLPAILASDADAIVKRLAFVDVPCADDSNPFPGPSCPVGVAVGTVIQAFSRSGCEATYEPAEFIIRVVEGMALPGLRLYAVYRVEQPIAPRPGPAAVYGVAFVGEFPGRPPAGPAVVVVTVDGEGHIVHWHSSCGVVDPEPYLDEEHPVAEFILPPLG